MKKTIVVVAGVLLVAGCAGNTPWENPQQYAGITHVDAQWNDNGNLKHVRVFSGKEGQSFDISANLKEGTVDWKGKGVRAFEGFASRAEVEKYVAEKFADAAPEIRTGLVELLTRLSGI